MIKNKILVILLVTLNCLKASSQSRLSGPGYRFDLFKNTSNWELAKAVEREDTFKITKLIKTGKYDINLKEPKFGRTLLLLAVGNDMYPCVKNLLENGANINLRDSFKVSPILEAADFIRFKKNSPQILKLLIKHGANVNDRCNKNNDKDTLGSFSPLVEATSNLECTKTLLDNGGDLYLKYGNGFPVWVMMFLSTTGENIDVAKYLIIDKKMQIPNPISFSVPNNYPRDIYYYLNFENFRNDTAKEKVKQEVLDYLHKIDFPGNQVYNK